MLPGNYIAKESGPVELLEPYWSETKRKVSSYLLLYGAGDSSEAFGINSIVLQKKKINKKISPLIPVDVELGFKQNFIYLFLINPCH